MGDHHGKRRQRRFSRALEQGQDRRAEGTFQAQGHLGAARSPPDGGPGARTRALQPGHRQQAARLRSRSAQGPGRMSWRSGGRTRHRHAAQDTAPGAVRDHAGPPGRLAGLGQAGRAEAGGLSIPQPAARLTSPGGPGSTPGSSGTGSTNWVWTAPTSGRTRCEGPRQR